MRSREYVAVQDVSFSVSPGMLISLLGPSGCGKSSLLRAIAGLIPYEGRIDILGSPVRGPGRDRGMVFQAASLFPWRTVLRNVSYGLEAARVPRREALRRARQILDLVGLASFADAYPKQLSGGMQQRVNLARALAADPPVLLLDEPFAALDAQTRERMQEEILRIWEQTRKAGLFVTHQIEEAVLVADRVVVLSRGPAARVVEVVDVPLARPRDDSTRTCPAFVDCVAHLRGLIKHEVTD